MLFWDGFGWVGMGPECAHIRVGVTKLVGGWMRAVLFLTRFGFAFGSDPRYSTASARSDGLLLLCGGRDANSVVRSLGKKVE